MQLAQSIAMLQSSHRGARCTLSSDLTTPDPNHVLMACFHACTAGAQPATVWDLWIVPWLPMANNTYNQSTIVHANSHYLTEQKKKKCIN